MRASAGSECVIKLMEELKELGGRVYRVEPFTQRRALNYGETSGELIKASEGRPVGREERDT